MALRVTNTTQTDKGETTGLYFHITEYYRNKAGQCQFPVVYYFDDTKAQAVEIFYGDLKKKYEFKLTEDEIGSDKFEAIAYGKIAQELIAAGLTVESDVTGAWVVVPAA